MALFNSTPLPANKKYLIQFIASFSVVEIPAKVSGYVYFSFQARTNAKSLCFISRQRTWAFQVHFTALENTEFQSTEQIWTWHQCPGCGSSNDLLQDNQILSFRPNGLKKFNSFKL